MDRQTNRRTQYEQTDGRTDGQEKKISVEESRRKILLLDLVARTIASRKELRENRSGKDEKIQTTC